MFTVSTSLFWSYVMKANELQVGDVVEVVFDPYYPDKIGTRTKIAKIEVGTFYIDVYVEYDPDKFWNFKLNSDIGEDYLKFISHGESESNNNNKKDYLKLFDRYN